MNTKALSDWLQALGLGEFETVFVENRVDLDSMRLLCRTRSTRKTCAN